MSVNLLETIEKNSGYPPIQKIDPNTQKPKEHVDKFNQAAIPAVLTGLYRYVQKDEGAEKILEVANSTMWVNRFFETEKDSVVRNIAAYGDRTYEETEMQMNAIANEAIRIVKQNLPANPGIRDVKDLMSNQKKDILLYLVPALNLGQLLHDETLDDTTNKMEGPVSSMMKNIGSAFTNPVTEEEINTRKE